ncbi:MAG TPA: cobyrinate a,c-diamide synthase [Noviherbaspirillum sp.]|uniref:cobyrinate a,c-diamide synthase n=1 Tax=Noviherbaspirillum sp. TaxID=1926288 RepID=UPI002B4966CD|nr:cobyrinate a,c-diamide synthase [Noviherbaspirillum sp.]HJV84607.1 cobyrinate a,c-diamide synthase [Noviherbaspirillum sp.]
MASSVKAVLVSAVASGQGKTTVTAALARKLVRSGMRVRVFKTGPDFLDPMMLQQAAGMPVQSLDLWMVGPDHCRKLLAQASADADVILIEGVMGLYDGTPSSADLARAFGVPVLAVIDASAMAQTAGALVLGLRDYGPVNLAGVIANRVGSPGHARMIKDAMPGVPLLATLARQEESLPERHLGLVQPGEIETIDTLLDRIADELLLDTEAWQVLPPVALADDDAAEPVEPLLRGKTIAIARDAAFAFLYPANLDCLRELGAELVFFSPLENEPVPKQADAIYLPGGYPELHAQRLSQAQAWQASIRDAHAAQRPILAECGGMMALTDSLADTDGQTWPMTGLLRGQVVMQKRLAALGSQGWSTPQGQLRGHAFHYSRLETDVAPFARTKRHPSGDAGEAIYRNGSLTASYFHAYFPSCPSAVAALFLGRAGA